MWPALFLSERNQAARSNCSSSPQALTYSHATVPHIVALLGLSFNAAKIGIFPLSSKFWAIFLFFCPQRRIIPKFFVLLQVLSAQGGRDVLWGFCPPGNGGTKGGDGADRVGYYFVEKRHCTLCFWLLERRKLKIWVHFKKWRYVLLSLKMLESGIFFVPLHL